MDCYNISDILNSFKDLNLVLDKVFDAKLYFTEDKIIVLNRDYRQVYTKQKYSSLDYSSLLSFELHPDEQRKELPLIFSLLAGILLKEYALSVQDRYSVGDGDFEAFFCSDMKWAHLILDKYLQG